MASTSSQRPQTSRPRGVCTYYSKPGGCLNGEMCKFLHGADESLSPYDKSKTCRFFSAGFCKHGDNCWFRHVSFTPPTISFPTFLTSPPVPTESTSSLAPAVTPDEDEHMCCICQEKPVTYGLMQGCSHICCLQCIRGWRDPIGKSSDLLESGNTKKCPYCRTTSHFVTPSSVFYRSGDPRKEVTIQKYKASMARIQCKYFERSMQRYCPFGRDCFYQHKNRDGTNHTFPFGADYYLERSRQRRRIAFPSASYEDPSPGLRRALATLRERLLTSAVSDSNDDVNERGAYRLLEDILTSFETSPPDDPMSYAAALGLMSSIFGGEDDEDDDDLSEDYDEDDLPPPLEPFSHVHEVPAQTISHSALPLTRSYMTSVSTNQDPEPHPIVINDPDDFGGVAVTTTIHVHHDDIEPSTRSVCEGEESYSTNEGTSGIRSASGTDLSALLHGRSSEAPDIPGQPPRPRSAFLSYIDDNQDLTSTFASGSQFSLQQRIPSTPPPPSAPALRSSLVGSLSNANNNDADSDGRSNTFQQQQSVIDTSAPATSAITTTPPSVLSESSRLPDTTSPSSSSSSRKESKRERVKSERERRSFVTDGRGHVVAIAEADPDATPSLFWTQPPVFPGHLESGDEGGTVDSGVVIDVLDLNAANPEGEDSSS